jgi:2-C-methyl-D-erythritol 4-phosphate cytidylyltransferase
MNVNGTGPAYGIVVAAGRSERMGGIDKVFAPVMGRPLLAWTLGAFKRCDDVAGVVVVAGEDQVERTRAFCDEWRFTKVRAVVAGGATRQDSVRAGLVAAGDAAIVVVHDAARPLVTPELISRGIAVAREAGAAVCAVPARDTVKEVDGDPPTVRTTHARERIWLAQTPQVFERGLLLRAHESATDPPPRRAQRRRSALVEAAGHEVRAYEGAEFNLKVTTPDDLVIAEALLRERFATSG